MISLRNIELSKLNTATKYPSIPTFHALGDRGRLLEEAVSFDGDEIVVTEKIDGTNSRVILWPDGSYLIGSREELLHAKGDLIHNPAQGIVDTLRSVADQLSAEHEPSGDVVTTVYFETYGGKTTAAAKQYTSNRQFGYRVFDVAKVPIAQLEKELNAISLWRENAGQDFLPEDDLKSFTARHAIELAPRIAVTQSIPTAIGETHEWLKSMIRQTQVALDENAGGLPEGVVVRTPDRKQIAKIRYEDYERHARYVAKQQK